MIKKDSMFLKLNKDISVERLNKLVNKKVYVDIYDKDSNGVCSYYLELIEVKDNEVVFKKEDEIIIIDISNIKGIEELINYNKNNIDFNSFIGKQVKMTDMNDNEEYVIIQDVDNDDVILSFDFENDNGDIFNTEDYSYPKYFVKNMQIK